jgi:hypothetical protein
VSPGQAYVLPGGTKQFSAVVSGADNPAQSVVWTVDGGDEGTTIDEHTGLLTVAAEEPSRTLTVRAVSTEAPDKSGTVTVTVVEVVDAENSSIKAKFGIEPGEQSVTETFTALHAYIQAGGLSSQTNAIQLGDYIDMDSLTVAAYGTGNITGALGGFTQNETNKLRLIVVGINSFQSGRGVKDDTGTTTVNGESGGQYAETANDGTPHVVFQFLNPPGNRRMEEAMPLTNANGYAGSEMRKYLVPVENDAASGAFLAGLTAAGVPQDVLWAPVRSIANKGEGADAADMVTDLLWLPTEREMNGVRFYSSTYETASNQARLEYYVPTPKNLSKENRSYWLASPGPAVSGLTSFCVVKADGNPHYTSTNMNIGCAPAFCVK